jgi:GntR family transcriptional repressor for pyruvate dehydrogenase complex
VINMAENGLTFERVGRNPRLSDTITEKLLDAIVLGRFKAGDLLPSERELGEQFGVSRTVIREAIRSLAARGVVEVQSGRGVLVVELDVGPVTQAMSLLVRSNDIGFPRLHEVRTMLERHTAGLAAERGTEENYAELEHICQRFAAAESTGDVDDASRLDVEFHRAIAKSTRNKLFLVLLDSISDALLEVRRETLAIPHSPTKVVDDHQRIFEAIRRHDPIGARTAMDAHLENAALAWHTAGSAQRDGAVDARAAESEAAAG